jgi:hypothetical protein
MIYNKLPGGVPFYDKNEIKNCEVAYPEGISEKAAL